MTEGLTAKGAALLRQVRDHLIAHPEDLDMRVWWTNGPCCVCGHLCRMLGATDYTWRGPFYQTMFGVEAPDNGPGWLRPTTVQLVAPLERLFYTFNPYDVHNVHTTVERINACLWEYNYPPDEIPATDAQLEEVAR
jgi:hypothetical protein